MGDRAQCCMWNPVHNGIRQAALAGALWPRLGKGGRPQRCMCTRAVRHAAALASVALICLLLCASTSHYDNIATLLPADKDVLRLMQLADRFLMEDCVRRCATLLNQIPVSRCCLNRHLSSSKLAVVDCEGKCLNFTLMAIVAPIAVSCRGFDCWEWLVPLARLHYCEQGMEAPHRQSRPFWMLCGQHGAQQER